jgi:hypothetical protein
VGIEVLDKIDFNEEYILVLQKAEDSPFSVDEDEFITKSKTQLN